MGYLERIGIVLVLSLLTSSVLGDDCENGSYFLCYSSRVVRSFVDKLNQSRKPLVIFPGLEIVSTVSANETDNTIDTEDDTVIGHMANYLRHHEINIKLSDLLDTTKIQRYIEGDEDHNKQVAARKKDNKTYMVAISLMFGKLLTVLGIGSIGALAMKALGVASMALLMTGMMGLKTLYQGTEETSHHVQYVSDGHHRRRRQAHPPPPPPWPLAYRGWKGALVQ